MIATWTPQEQVELVNQLRAEGFPANPEAAAQFTAEMASLINQGFPFSIEVAHMAMWKAGIDCQPPEPALDEEQEAAPAAARIQRNVDAYIAEQAEKMTDDQLQRELYNRGAFGVPVDGVENLSDSDLEKVVRRAGLL